MRKISIIMLIPWLFCCSCQKTPVVNNDIANSLNKIPLKEGYRRWFNKASPTIKETGIINIEILNSAITEFKDIPGTYIFIKIKAIEKTQNWQSEAYRLLSIARDKSGNESIFYDSGYYQPECGGAPDISFSKISSIILGSKPIIVVDIDLQPIACVDTPNKEIIKSLFYVAQPSYRKVLEIEKSYINYNDVGDGKQGNIVQRYTYYYANGCANDSCSYLTVLVAHPKCEYQTYVWNSDSTALIPFEKSSAK